MLLLGLDPGLSGALAIYDPTEPYLDKPYRLEVIDMPVIGEDTAKRVDGLFLFNWLDPRQRLVSLAVIELVSAMPSQRENTEGERVGMPAYLAMRFGDAVATARTSIVCREIPYAMVTPGVWRREAGLARPRTPKGAPKPELESKADVKNRSRLKAIEAFPEYADQFERRKDENKAEAALIARFGAVRRGLVSSLDPLLLV